MAIAAERSGRETLATTFILDGDVHLNEPPAELAEYAEAPWDLGLREIAKTSGLYFALPGMAPRAEYRVPWPGGVERIAIEASNPYQLELEDLGRAIRTGSTPLLGREDAVAQARVIAALRRSAADGRDAAP